MSIVRALMNEVADIAKADGVIISQEHMAKMLEATQNQDHTILVILFRVSQ